MRFLLPVLFLAACRDKPPAPASNPQDASIPAAAESLPPMPPHPVAARGRLAVQSAGGPREIKGDWAAEAGVCVTPPMMLVVAQVQGMGTVVRLSLPDTNRVTSYPITTVAGGLPPPPAAQVGVQVFRPDGPAAYQGGEGSVEIYEFAKLVSGRFAVTLRQISTNARIQYAGAFREIPVKPLDRAHCAVAGSAAKR